MFKYLNDVPPSDHWFPYEYIDAEVNNKVYKTKGQLAGDEMEKETKNYVEYLNHDTNWLKTITIEIDRFLINRKYIDFFMQMYMQWSKDNGSTSSFRKLIIPRLPSFEKLVFQNSIYILKLKQQPSVLCVVIAKRLFSFNLLKVKISFVFYTC